MGCDYYLFLIDMNRYIVIQNNVVTNIVKATPEFVAMDSNQSKTYLIYQDGVDIGDSYINGEFVSEPNVFVPSVTKINPMRIRLGLTIRGKRAAVEALVAASDQTVKDAWQHAKEFKVDSPLLNSLRQHPSIGWSYQELCEFFEECASIEI